MSEYLTLKEVAKTLNVSPRTVDRILKARKLPYIRISRQYRIDKKHFDKFIEKNTRNLEAIHV